jgi:hypothetical protein
MVNRAGPGAAIVLAGALLAGCPQDVGRNLQEPSNGLVAPSSLRGIPNGGSEIALSWADRSDTETGFRLEINSVPFGSGVVDRFLPLPANTTTWTLDSAPNRTYYIRLFAVTETMESDPSNEIQVRTPDVPARPEGVTAVAASPVQIDVSWQDVDNETGFRVERSDDGGRTWTFIAALSAHSMEFSQTTLSPNTEYGYRIQATNDVGGSTISRPAFDQTAADGLKFYAPSPSTDVGAETSFPEAPDGYEQIAFTGPASSAVFCASRTPSTPYAIVVADDGPTAGHDVGGDGVSMARDPAGFLHVVAHDATSDALSYATNESGKWIVTTLSVSPGTSLGGRPKIACDPATGILHVVYQARASGGPTTLRYAARLPNRSWVLDTFDSVEVDPTSIHSLALDPSGVPHVLMVPFSGNLYHVVRPSVSTMAGTTGQQVLLPAGIGGVDFTTMGVDGSGVVHAAVRGKASNSLYSLTQDGTGWQFETIHSDPARSVGASCSMVISPTTGRLHVAYYDETRGDLRYARKDPGGPWVLRLIDAQGDVGNHASISLGSSDHVYVAYRDATNHCLKVAFGAP